MGKKKTSRLCMGRPRVINKSTLVMGLYSTETGRVGQVLLSVNVIALYGGAVEATPELIEKLKDLLAPEKNNSFQLNDVN